MSGPRLLVLCHGFPPFHGGAELAAGYLAREAARDGWAVDVVTSDLGRRLPPEETWEGVRIRRIPARKKEWGRHTLTELAFFYLAARRRLPEILRLKPDFVLAHFSFPAGLLARRIWRKAGIPYGVVLHGSDVPGYQPERFRWVYPGARPWVRRVWRGAHYVAAVSESLRTLAHETWPNGRIEVIGNGVDTELFRPREPAERSPGPLQVISVAQLIERKGLRYLVEALSAEECLTICGVGPQEAELRALAAARGLSACVKFAGVVEPRVMPERLRAADVFVLPSCCEGMPLALLEAMACGLAVVATAVGGIGDILRDGINGIVVPPADSAAVRRALDRLRDPDLRNRLGAAARQTALRHGWAAIWRRHRDLIFRERVL